MPLLDLVRDSLEARAARLSETPVTVQALAGWFDSTAGGRAALDALVAQAVGANEALDYRSVAVLGIGFADRPHDHEISERFRSGLEWMQGRKFFVPNRPLSFEADSTAILGLALGIRALTDSHFKTKAREWLNNIVGKAARSEQLGDWERSLVSSADILLNGCRDEVVAKIAGDMGLVLETRGVLPISESRETTALKLIYSENLVEIPPERGVARLCAIRWLFRNSARVLPGRATSADALEVLNVVSHSLKRWPWEKVPRTTGVRARAQRWDVQNEYHVQSLLWALLAPIFPDLEDEEYLRSIGFKHPRADLAIPSLRLIIEVKFLRESTQRALSDVIEQIAADAGLYLSSPSSFSEMLVFVWDDARSTELHSDLRNGLLKLAGVKGAIVVARPGGWNSLGEKRR